MGMTGQARQRSGSAISLQNGLFRCNRQYRCKAVGARRCNEIQEYGNLAKTGNYPPSLSCRFQEFRCKAVAGRRCNERSNFEQGLTQIGCRIAVEWRCGGVTKWQANHCPKHLKSDWILSLSDCRICLPPCEAAAYNLISCPPSKGVRFPQRPELAAPTASPRAKL
jgi:hypothetical protein